MNKTLSNYPLSLRLFSFNSFPRRLLEKETISAVVNPRKRGQQYIGSNRRKRGVHKTEDFRRTKTNLKEREGKEGISK